MIKQSIKDMHVLLLPNESCNVPRLRSKEVEGYVTHLVKAMFYFFHCLYDDNRSGKDNVNDT